MSDYHASLTTEAVQMTAQINTTTHMSFGDVAKYIEGSEGSLRRRTDPDDPYYNKQLARDLSFSTATLKECLSRGEQVHRITEANTATLLGVNVEVLRSLDSLKPEFSNWYSAADVDAYLSKYGTFIGGCAPSAKTISDVFELDGFLYGIVIDQHDNKFGGGAADFSGPLSEYLEKEITPWRNEPDVFGVIGDACPDIHRAREILLHPFTQAKLLSASVEVRLSDDAQWINVRLIGAVRFYHEMGVPPFFCSLAAPDEL